MIVKPESGLLSRRALLAAALLVSTGAASASTAPALVVHKTSGCGCCVLWIKRLEADGFRVTARNVGAGELVQEKLKAGLKLEHTSCHTARVNGYLVEGHVPPREIRRLLSEKPDAIGLAVPGMPIGSPGMEAGGEVEPYEVLLVARDGSTTTFARYP